ncbi:hypothetical protein ASPWEDRAFT_167836 [Aspergillus wentii DTO 134E9]|uniref:NAD(P)-binding domain-containing protein n=1 Tax=Aspergillus wentii DTO 134E9 TaxID=1073089 RepID=A0A1L9S3V5_ASPWE|nr:uncharacterized protein ASPWEDRAFT_167836 [Aspergillus wentii DTO 134E9]KAI9930168.1 hypothetical protein MW887_011979 [Aspergillus wentii]OJJ41840.1 hypothetical protein ASPWEDRAFT_167836 [Aspergillus wentii DTO 134E9]
MSEITKTIAFFGATGGCTNACLAHLLKSDTNLHAVALARTPSKLLTQLHNQGITQETLDTRLRIIQGDATDTEAVKSTLVLQDTTTSEKRQLKLVNTIIVGIGGTPTLQKKSLIPRFTLDNPHITEEFTRALLHALSEVVPFAPERPLLGVISTTGLTAGTNAPRDVPCVFKPMYNTLLAVPHEDKEKMERMLDEESADVLRGLVIVRPSLLVGDQDITTGKGWKTLRVGVEKDPAVGYTISRADVGEWIFEEIVKGGGGKWIGEKVTLTS